MTIRSSFQNSYSRQPWHDNESSGLNSSYNESSLTFVAGDYEHNKEILSNIADESERDDVDEERLIYLATKKLAKESDYEQRRQIVVSSRELDGDEPSRQMDVDDSAQAVHTSEHNCILQNFFMIFKGDDSFMEVSREEIQRVRIMHKRFAEGSEFSFNYNVLLIIASLIAALGLGGNSTATVIASMLVSPLMGPVMGMAYGASILDLKLFNMAFRTELFSLFACIGVGAIVSGCMIPFYELPEEWPTDEMKSRANMANFFIGIPIAFASGLGVAVSVLDEQTSSLVGVAISASLLPPAINAGMLWTTYFFFDEDANQVHEFGIEGLISLGLTLINILMIILSSMLMFRLKEKMPIKKKKIFWTDLGLARKIYQNQALYNNDQQSPIRRMGQRVSKLFVSSNEIAESNRSTSTRVDNNRVSVRTTSGGSISSPKGRGRRSLQNTRGLQTLEIPDGSADAAARARALSTVVEERISGYSSS